MKKLLSLILVMLTCGCSFKTPAELAEIEKHTKYFLSQGVIKLRLSDVEKNKVKKEILLEEAKAYFEMINEIQADNPLAWDGIGSVLLRQGKTQESITTFRKVILLNPSYSAAYAHLALAYEVNRDFALAHKYYEIAREKNSFDPYVLHNVARYSQERSPNDARAKKLLLKSKLLMKTSDRAK